MKEEDKELTANRLDRKGEFEAANLLYTEILEEYPATDRLYYRRGKNNVRLSNNEAAHNDFSLAIRYCKTNADYFGSRGILLCKMDKLEEAKQDLRFASFLSKGSNGFRWYLGLVYYRLEEYEDAIYELKKSRDINPKLDVCELLTLCYLRQSNYEMAYAELIIAEMQTPDEHWVQFNLGFCIYKFALNEAMNTPDPKVIEAMANKFQNLSGIKNTDLLIAYYKGAKTQLTKSINIDPTFPHAYWLRGKCNSCLGLIEEAAADFSNAIKYKPDIESLYEGWEWAHEGLLG